MANSKDKELLIRVRADLKKAKAELAKLSKDISKTGKSAQSASKKVDTFAASTDNAAGSASLLAKAARFAGPAIVAMIAVKTIKNATLLAARLETLNIVLGVVGRNAGFTKGEMEKTVEQVKALGITSQVATRTVIRMTQAELGLAEATKLARVAQDAAVVGQVNSSDALNRMLHGIVTLQPEILRTIGITISFEREYARFAKGANRLVKSLTSQEKKQIGLNAVLREGKKLSGSYTEAMKTAGKQMSSMAREAETLSEELGKLFQERFKESITLARRTLRGFAADIRGINVLLGTTGFENFSLERIDEKIKNTRAELDKLRKAYKNNAFTAVLFDLGVASSLESEIEALKKARVEISRRSQRPEDAIPITGAVPATREPKETPAQKAAREKAEKLLLNLKKQTRLLGDSSAIAAASESINFGDLRGLDPELATQLFTQAKAFDAKRIAQQKAAKAERELASNQEADTGTLNSLRENIRLIGLSSREQAQAIAVAELSKDATKEQAEEVRKLAGEYFDLQNSLVKTDEELTEIANAVRDTLDPYRALRREQAELNVLLKAGKLNWDEYGEAMLNVEDRIEKMEEEAKKAGQQLDEFSRQAARNIQSALGDEVLNVIEGDFSSIGDSFTRMINRMVAEAIAADLARVILGDDFGKTGELGGIAGGIGSFISGLFHQGGIAGQGTQGRSVSPLAFAGAQRYHGGGLPGIRRNEVPAILERGEEILTRDDPRHVANGGGSGLTIIQKNYFSVLDGRDLMEKIGPHGRQLAELVQQSATTYNTGGS